MTVNREVKSILLIYITITICLFLAAAYGFLSPYYLPSAQPQSPTTPALTNKIVMVLVDGMRKDFAFNPQVMPNLHQLVTQGASGTARTGGFPLTIAAMRAIGSGTNYSARDILHNYERVKETTVTPSGKVKIVNKQGLDTSIDSVLHRATAAGKKIVLAGDQIWLACYANVISESILSIPDPEHPHGSSDDTGVHQGALQFLQEADFDLLIVHYESIDRIGHNTTPLSGKYRKKSREIDQFIGELAANLPAQTTLFVFSDHGMSDEGWHGKLDAPPSVVIDAPFVFAKQGIKHLTNLSVDQIDLAPTLALLLGVAIPSQSEGIALTEIFATTPEITAQMALANLRARQHYLQQLPLIKSSTTSAAQTAFDQSNYLQTITLAQQELRQLNQQVEQQTKFQLSAFTRSYLVLSVVTILLLILANHQHLTIAWTRYAISLLIWLPTAAIIAIYLIPTTDSFLILRNFLILMGLWLLALACPLSYRLLRQQPFNRELPLLGLLTLLTLTIIIPNTINFAQSLLFIGLLVTAGYYPQSARERFILLLGLVALALLGLITHQGLFLTSKVIRALTLTAAAGFIGWVAIQLPRLAQLGLLVIASILAIMTRAGGRWPVISKFEAAYLLSFFAMLLFLWVLAKYREQATPGNGLLGLLLILQASLTVDYQIGQQLTTTNKFSYLLLLAFVGLLYQLYQYFLAAQSLTLVTHLQQAGLGYLAAITALIGRCLVLSQTRHRLGQIAFCLLLTAFLIWIWQPAATATKIYIMHLFAATLAVIVFEPLHIMIILLVLYVEVTLLKNYLQALPLVGFQALYIVIGTLFYYVCYKNLSLSSFFEEGRATILGAQLTDYSYWNLTVIAIFLSAKLLLVELLLLFPLTHFAELSTSLGNFTRHLANQIILAIVLLMGLIWWQFAPGNQQLLSLLATTLLFLGVKLVVISLSALLLNPIFTPRPVIINQPN